MIYNYLAFESLKRAGRDDLAKDLCDKMTNNFYNDIVKNGKVDECYNPDTGEPIMNQSFISWNALIVKMIKECE
jgi:putative isomerase